MPREKTNAASSGLEKEVEPEEQVNLEDTEEIMEEEVEYEEVEEEVEEYEEEEEVEEEVEEEEEEEEEEDEVTNAASSMDVEPSLVAGKATKKQDESKEHAELLSLPPHGAEVYIGNIPRETSEENLRKFCETIGEVTEVRIMKGKDSGGNKGYAFVAFRSKELASKAIDDLDSAELLGKKVKVSKSQAKNKLFIGNIPRTWSEDDLRGAVCKVGPGVTIVELVKDTQNSSRNRGFAFIEYYNHTCAEYSRKNMSVAKFKLDTNNPTVSWADQKNADSTTQIKAIYVKNLPKDVTQDQLKELFQHHGEITKVILPPAKPGHEKSRYGFVHFAEKSAAAKAIKDTEKYELDGQVLESSLAKPPNEKKNEVGPSTQKPILPAYPLRGYGAMGTGYNLPGNFGMPPFPPSMIYGRAPAPAGVAMVPMILPDGRLGYVLQQPGAPAAPSQPQQRGGNRSGSSSGGRHGGDNNRSRRHRPY